MQRGQPECWMHESVPTCVPDEGQGSAQSGSAIMVKIPEDVRPPSHEDGDELRPGEKLVIVIDNKKYQAPARMMTGAQLRRLSDPNIGPAFDLWQEIPGDEDNLVDDHERIKLAAGMGFYSSSRDINPG